jgi:hypothetical protein
MRYGGRIVILNAEVDAGEGDKTLEMSWVNHIQGDEEVYYRIYEWLEEKVAPCN